MCEDILSTSGAESPHGRPDFIAALKALRHPKPGYSRMFIGAGAAGLRPGLDSRGGCPYVRLGGGQGTSSGERGY
jgi:hypothetical protein